MFFSPFVDAAFFAYIDPGLLSAALQALFAIIFGVLAGYVLAPWRLIKRVFRRGKTESLAEDSQETHQEETGDEPAV